MTYILFSIKILDITYSNNESKAIQVFSFRFTYMWISMFLNDLWVMDSTKEYMGVILLYINKSLKKHMVKRACYQIYAWCYRCTTKHKLKYVSTYRTKDICTIILILPPPTIKIINHTFNLKHTNNVGCELLKN